MCLDLDGKGLEEITVLLPRLRAPYKFLSLDLADGNKDIARMEYFSKIIYCIDRGKNLNRTSSGGIAGIKCPEAMIWSSVNRRESSFILLPYP